MPSSQSDVELRLLTILSEIEQAGREASLLTYIIDSSIFDSSYIRLRTAREVLQVNREDRQQAHMWDVDFVAKHHERHFSQRII